MVEKNPVYICLLVHNRVTSVDSRTLHAARLRILFTFRRVVRFRLVDKMFLFLRPDFVLTHLHDLGARVDACQKVGLSIL